MFKFHKHAQIQNPSILQQALKVYYNHVMI